MVATALTPERAIRQPRRVDGRVLVGLFLMLATTAGGIVSRPSATTAAGGRVRPGDEVVVIASFEKGKTTSRTEVVIPRATVYDVGEDRPLTVVNTGGADASTRAAGSIGWISLIVTQEQAIKL